MNVKSILFFSLSICVINIAISTKIDPNLDKLFQKIEKEEGIPKDLLKSISIKESGGPWPWTVGINGKGLYFKTLKEATKCVMTALPTTKNIDIGCMQINLMHHQNAFKNLEDFFKPENNIRYAAKFLKKLRASSNSWQEAVEKYHSANQIFNQPYKNKVFNIWKDVRYKKFQKINSKIDSKTSTNKKYLKNNYIDVFYKEIAS